MLGNRKQKAQSAMEYLMTYGWAILIIAVVLGALFSLGVFNNAGLGIACIASPGYLCQAPILGTTGNLGFTFGQNTGATIYTIGLACAATANTLGYPSGGFNAFNSIFANGLANSLGGFASVVAGIGTTIASGQTIAVSGLPCVGNTGLPLGTAASPATVGTAFSGFIWLNYTTNPYSSSTFTNDPWYTVKIATVSLKVV